VNARAGWVTRIGLAVVLTAAAVLSFAALRDLAIAVRIHRELAWLLPIAVDAGAAVSCGAWLSPRSPADAARFARWLTYALLTLTVAANAAGLGMAAAGVTPPWWVAVLVGAIPPAVVGGTVHLAVLLGRVALPSISGGEDKTDPLTDAELLEHLREWVTEEAGVVPSRERIRVKYGIGTGRADRLRTTLTDGQFNGVTVR
jgi:hypothetical protein